MHRTDSSGRTRAAVAALVLALVTPGLAACGLVHRGPGGGADAPPRKVLLVMEENSDPGEVLDPGAAPYLQTLLELGANLTDMDAGYPADCPSLPGYLLVTSGSTHGVCDDDGPQEHAIDGPSIFSEVADTGREWRVFAESMDTNCRRENTEDHRYLVRHTGAPYYTSETERCSTSQVPLGTPTSGELASAVDAGLPAFSLVVPDSCNDMHGGDACEGDRVEVGDRWLSRWVPAVLASPDYRSGALMVIITWDESHDDEANHVPTLVLHDTVAGTTVEEPRDHCSTLRTMTDWLQLEPLGCAADAEPLVTVKEAR